MFAGSLEKSGADFEAPPDDSGAEPFFVWSPQPVTSRAPATAIAPTAAIRDFEAVVRRVVLAVMIGFLRQVVSGVAVECVRRRTHRSWAVVGHASSSVTTAV
ncbi:hypothetical protein GCM10010326_74090 [Streptomyces xanthochromogenes]|uniref:Uncharacterized protein n=1 Tax=Streptomyces xanthochromogenes TaxID=67384 RepID=A0ABQ3AX00_9ACTN|nr:hypothetical protein GCM10010326_74090 [Streptomyces xanthochromogenes]